MAHLGTGILLLLLGYLVKYRQWTWLIAGYNTSSRKEKDKYDKDALCKGMGNFLFILAGLNFISAAGSFLNWAWLVNAGWITFIAAIIIFLVYANTGNRYKQDS